MNKTILVLLGFVCALVTAAGIMWYNITPNEQLIVSTQLIPERKDDKVSFSSIPDNASYPPSELPSHNNPLNPFIVQGKIHMNQYEGFTDRKEPDTIEKLALDYINKIIPPANKLKSIKAKAEIQFSSDRKLTKYSLYIYEKQPIGHEPEGVGYDVILRKFVNDWIIISTEGRFKFRETANWLIDDE